MNKLSLAYREHLARPRSICLLPADLHLPNIGLQLAITSFDTAAHFQDLEVENEFAIDSGQPTVLALVTLRARCHCA